MKRLLVVLTALTALAAPASAAAHPLGNFTTNRYTRIEPSGGRLYALYVLDLAEIPTYQERGQVRRLGRQAYARRLATRIAGNLTLSVDGAPRTLRRVRHAIAFPRGAGGLGTTRLEIVFDAGPARAGAPRQLVYADENFAGRLGWREIVVRPTEGARVVSSSAPAQSVSDELRAYPENLLESPLEVTRASIRVLPGSGEGTRPALSGETDGPATAAPTSESGFAALVSEEELGLGVILASLLAALFWGGAHALTPGHGKAIVAAYLVGARGTARHAALLGVIVTVTHTIGVFSLGLVTLALSEFIVPEQLYPWLNLVSALLVVAVGVAVLRYRLRPPRPHGHDHHHGPGGHQHVPEQGSGARGLVAVGVSGGLLPCPTALVVLLAAISLHRVAYGLVLIVAFSIGLASVITAIGLLAVTAKRTFGRMSFEGRLVRALPAVSAAVIVALGLAMTVRSLPALV
ncbi:MAG: nickel/cobalt transporter [Gaiellaceae bacterium]